MTVSRGKQFEMKVTRFWQLTAMFALVAGTGLTIIPSAPAQQRAMPDSALVAARNAKEKELESIAIIDRKVMVTMSDGKKMAADVYRPKDTSKKVPIIF